VNEIRKSTLFFDGKDQAVKIPAEFKLDASEVTITKDGDRLIIEADKPKPSSLREYLDSLDPVDVDWPDVDEGLLPLEDVNL